MFTSKVTAPKNCFYAPAGNTASNNRCGILKSKIKIRPIFLHLDEHIRGLTLITFIALLAYCILEHLAKKHLDTKTTTHRLMKEFAAIVFSEGEMHDGTHFQTVGNVKKQHIRLINRLGLSIGCYDAISEVLRE